MELDERTRERAQEMVERERLWRLDQLLNRPREIPLVRDGVRICLGCKDPIEPARLAVQAHAVRCTGCQQQHEDNEKRRGA